MNLPLDILRIINLYAENPKFGSLVGIPAEENVFEVNVNSYEAFRSISLCPNLRTVHWNMMKPGTQHNFQIFHNDLPYIFKYFIKKNGNGYIHKWLFDGDYVSENTITKNTLTYIDEYKAIHLCSCVYKEYSFIWYYVPNTREYVLYRYRFGRNAKRCGSCIGFVAFLENICYTQMKYELD
jgi:hypothetical protein